MPTGLVPDAEVRISDDLVSRLLSAQHPDLADLPRGERHEGWDNITIRLGEDLAVRLPRRQLGADLASREHRWLRELASGWDFTVPAPVRLGAPGEGYPWPWSVVPYLEGDRCFDAPLTDAGAKDLGKALAQVHRPAPADAPRNPVRSATLAERAELFDARLNTLVAMADAPADLWEDDARAAFEAGARAGRELETWAHLDLHGGNVLTSKGRLAALLDWGDLGVADPATDLGQALCLVGRRSFRPLLDAYARAGGAASRRKGLLLGGGLDEVTALRVEAEALTYAAMLACHERAIQPGAGWDALVDLGYARAR
ncbi:phosphotransferase [Demequina capsici]|uniref:Phosphotransferase n=1 Tax=Demequina capsici TaxID=3075620 RepID=A0AA96JG21_9MICO|nr:phosphotransferase [Demequina sp. PMTSA13]WNM27479.1 phosphotransferase [Demequina sp. PMTSA13]